jgi:hypothetical protein
MIDDLIEQMQADEEADEVAASTLVRPIKYARAHGIRPQKVYAALRSGAVQKVICPCGALCLDRVAADTYFGFSEPDEETEEFVDGHLERF